MVLTFPDQIHEMLNHELFFKNKFKIQERKIIECIMETITAIYLKSIYMVALYNPHTEKHIRFVILLCGSDWVIF